jgi:hypothetical protein
MAVDLLVNHIQLLQFAMTFLHSQAILLPITREWLYTLALDALNISATDGDKWLDDSKT